MSQKQRSAQSTCDHEPPAPGKPRSDEYPEREPKNKIRVAAHTIAAWPAFIPAAFFGDLKSDGHCESMAETIASATEAAIVAVETFNSEEGERLRALFTVISSHCDNVLASYTEELLALGVLYGHHAALRALNPAGHVTIAAPETHDAPAVALGALVVLLQQAQQLAADFAATINGTAKGHQQKGGAR